MPTSIKRVIAVLNDFSMSDEILSKTFSIAQKHNARVEILFVHETPLFDVPDFFSASKKSEIIDKNKIKKALIEKIGLFENLTQQPAIFVNIDDTEDRVWNLVKEEKEILIITSYHKGITQKLIEKTIQPILILKTNTKEYQKVAIIVDAKSHSSACINKAQDYFNQDNVELFYDYRDIVDPEMEVKLHHAQIIEEAQKDAFEALKKESQLKSELFIDGDLLGKQMNEYLQSKAFDVLYLCSHEDGFFISSTLTTTLLNDLSCDMLVANRG